MKIIHCASPSQAHTCSSSREGTVLIHDGGLHCASSPAIHRHAGKHLLCNTTTVAVDGAQLLPKARGGTEHDKAGRDCLADRAADGGDKRQQPEPSDQATLHDPPTQPSAVPTGIDQGSLCTGCSHHPTRKGVPEVPVFRHGADLH